MPDEDIVVYCWPHTTAAAPEAIAPPTNTVTRRYSWLEKETTYKKTTALKQHTKIDPVITVAVCFFTLWVLVILFGVGLKVYGNTYFIIKAFPLLLMPMLAAKRGLTHIRINWRGITMESASGKAALKRNLIPWSDISRIYLDEPRAGQSCLQGKLVITTMKGKKSVIPLKKIATASEWKKLVSGIRLCRPEDSHVLMNLDPGYLDGLDPERTADPSYTKLWLDALTAPPRIGRLLPLEAGVELQQGKYKIERPLGSGGQGSAYLAKTNTGEFVALKEYILPVYVEKTVRKHSIEAFQHEAQTLMSLRNEHIVRMLDSFVEDQRAYLVLEYVRGASLRQLIKTSGPIDEEQCINLAKQMCESLTYIHEQSPPIVHQDFTPDNLILNDTGKLVLIDFMVSKRQQDDSATTTVVGKHHYMPPEQFRQKATTQSDLYAMGCTLYFLLTGEDPEPMMPAHPILARASVSKRLDEIVEKATQLDCGQRYSSAGEILRDLQLDPMRSR